MHPVNRSHSRHHDFLQPSREVDNRKRQRDGDDRHHHAAWCDHRPEFAFYVVPVAAAPLIH